MKIDYQTPRRPPPPEARLFQKPPDRLDKVLLALLIGFAVLIAFAVISGAFA
jgi:hypothetical protein